jgi:hypothetical protein
MNLNFIINNPINANVTTIIQLIGVCVVLLISDNVFISLLAAYSLNIRDACVIENNIVVHVSATPQ